MTTPLHATSPPVPSQNSVPPSSPFKKALLFTLKWPPRVCIAAVGGYYSLGVAYEYGIMAAIDKLAIRFLKHWVGSTGIGALMPTAQWYAAWGVRGIAALGAGKLYDLAERIVLAAVKVLKRVSSGFGL